MYTIAKSFIFLFSITSIAWMNGSRIDDTLNLYAGSPSRVDLAELSGLDGRVEVIKTENAIKFSKFDSSFEVTEEELGNPSFWYEDPNNPENEIMDIFPSGEKEFHCGSLVRKKGANDYTLLHGNLLRLFERQFKLFEDEYKANYDEDKYRSFRHIVSKARRNVISNSEAKGLSEIVNGVSEVLGRYKGLNAARLKLAVDYYNGYEIADILPKMTKKRVFYLSDSMQLIKFLDAFLPKIKLKHIAYDSVFEMIHLLIISHGFQFSIQDSTNRKLLEGYDENNLKISFVNRSPVGNMGLKFGDYMICVGEGFTDRLFSDYDFIYNAQYFLFKLEDNRWVKAGEIAMRVKDLDTPEGEPQRVKLILSN